MQPNHNTKIGILFLLFLIITILFYTQYLASNSNSLSLSTSAKTYNQSPAPTCAPPPRRCPQGGTCNAQSKTCVTSSVPTSPPETVTGDYCRDSGCSCRNNQDCNNPNFCGYTGYTKNGHSEKLCGTPRITFLSMTYDYVFTQDNFNNSDNSNLAVIHNVVDENNAEYMYSCNWKTNADYKKGSGTISTQAFFNVASQENCPSNLGTYTFAIKINLGSSTKPIWIEKKQVYSITENNPKVCYLPVANGLISFKPDSCLVMGKLYYLCTEQTNHGSLEYGIASQSRCKSITPFTGNSYGCSLRIADPPSYIKLLPNQCYEQNGQYQICDYNPVIRKFELKAGEKTYCQNHLQK